MIHFWCKNGPWNCTHILLSGESVTTCSMEYNSSTVETNPWTYLHRTDKLSLWMRGLSPVIAIHKEIKCKGKNVKTVAQEIAKM